MYCSFPATATERTRRSSHLYSLGIHLKGFLVKVALLRVGHWRAMQDRAVWKGIIKEVPTNHRQVEGWCWRTFNILQLRSQCCQKLGICNNKQCKANYLVDFFFYAPQLVFITCRNEYARFILLDTHIYA